eukprot:4835291-Prymnesium_polylepis.1
MPRILALEYYAQSPLSWQPALLDGARPRWPPLGWLLCWRGFAALRRLRTLLSSTAGRNAAVASSYALRAASRWLTAAASRSSSDGEAIAAA